MLAVAAGLAIAEPAEEEEGPSNSVEILQAPQPLYPMTAAILGIEGRCEVRFNLLGGGTIVDIDEIACTHPIFCGVSRDAVRNARFRVIDVPGAAYSGERENIVYPLEFKMSEHEVDWPPGETCASDLVS